MNKSDGSNLVLGIAAGLVAALIAAIVWGLISSTTRFQIGYMAIGVGFVVAFAMRIAGRGHDKRFAIASGLISLLGCVLGNYFTVCFSIAAKEHADVLAVTTGLLPRFVDVITATFDLMDLVFYAIGAYFGFRYAITPPRRREMITETGTPPTTP
ncbi:MAG TPA: hypothetical protein VK702_05625 [Candidatus Acidoferrum sp.]|jgi:hypothetical protein|nr:hypothetical protein [Candidatus Acidoferrum sp.]